MTYEDRYIGDGVYASFDGYHIILDLRAQDSTTRIALEPPVMALLMQYCSDVETLRLAERDRQQAELDRSEEGATP